MTEQKEELIVAKRVKKDNLVVTRNTMAYASYSHDPNQEKLMFAAMIVIRKMELENQGNIDPNTKIRISARNYAELTHQKHQIRACQPTITTRTSKYPQHKPKP